MEPRAGQKAVISSAPRKGILALGLLAAVLVLDGPPQVAEGAPQETQEVAAPTLVGSVQTSEDVIRVVSQVNPTLSENELVRIGDAVIRCNSQYQLEPELVTAIMVVESAGQPWIRSPKGAMGLMQVMPYMHDRLELAGNITTIESNVEAGCLILANNIERLGEDDGVSAYFWGSDIRGVGYLRKVRNARIKVRRLVQS